MVSGEVNISKISNDPVTLECICYDCNLVSFASRHFIGEGRQRVNFLWGRNINKTEIIEPYTKATLVAGFVLNGRNVMVARLELVVQAELVNAIVTCINGGTEETATINITLSSMLNEMLQYPLLQHVYIASYYIILA